MKPEENLLESARQVAKEHAAGPPRAPGHVSVQPSAQRGFLKPEANLQESARQVAKGAGRRLGAA